MEQHIDLIQQRDGAAEEAKDRSEHLRLHAQVLPARAASLGAAASTQPQQALQPPHDLGLVGRRRLAHVRAAHLATHLDEGVDELEHDALDGRRLGEQNAAQRTRMAQQLEKGRCDRGVPIEAQAIDGTLQRRGQLLAKHGAR